LKQANSGQKAKIMLKFFKTFEDVEQVINDYKQNGKTYLLNFDTLRVEDPEKEKALELLTEAAAAAGGYFKELQTNNYILCGSGFGFDVELIV
jgi:hypothetical protein